MKAKWILFLLLIGPVYGWAQFAGPPPLFRPALNPDFTLFDSVALDKRYKSPVFLPKWRADVLPFFCQLEHRWEKKGKTPLKFRLGSVDYVDWLEGKRYFDK